MRSPRLLSKAVLAASATALLLAACGSDPPPEGNYFQVVTLRDIRIITNLGTYIQTIESSMNITAGMVQELPEATGNVTIIGPVWTNWAGKLTVNDARLPAYWRVQANSGECAGQYITDFISVARGDTIYPWCRLIQQLRVPSQTFNADDVVVDQTCCFTDILI